MTTILSPANDAEIQHRLLEGRGAICHPTAMIRRAAIEKIGGYDSFFRNAEDLDLWLRLGEIGELANLPAPLIRYRMHGGAQSAKRDEQKHFARVACERAWARRGVEGRFDSNDHWRPGSDRDSRHEFLMQYGWWAFASGHRRTAAAYGLRAAFLKPWATGGWKLTACAAIKPLSPAILPHA